MTAEGLTGVWAAALTPIDEQLRPDARKAVAYYGDLLRDGCAGINLLGTTGEAASFGTGQRLRLMEAVAAEIDPSRVMAGTGTTSLDDTVHLTQAAFDCGFAAALLLPPFFYRGISHDGVVRYVGALLGRVDAPKSSILLYNFPALTGIAFTAALVDRLIEEYPGVIAGIKDSSNDPALQSEILERHRHLAVFPSSEEVLDGARASGLAGCISGSVALWPQLSRRVFETAEPSQAARLRELRRAVAGERLLPRVRYLTAKMRDDDSWERAMPPCDGLSDAEKRALETAIERCA